MIRRSFDYSAALRDLDSRVTHVVKTCPRARASTCEPRVVVGSFTSETAAVLAAPTLRAMLGDAQICWVEQVSR